MLKCRDFAFMVLAGILAAVFPTTASHAATDLIVAAWPGGYDKIFEEKILPEFLKEHDVKIHWVLGGSVANVAKVRASRNSPEMDVLFVDDLPQRTGVADGLWEPLSPNVVTNLSSLRDVARLPGDQGVGLTLSIAGLIYLPNAFNRNNLTPPDSWNDLFRKDLHGRVMLTPLDSNEGLFTLVQLARMNGGSEHNIDAGFSKLKELLPQMLAFPQGVAVQASMFQRNEGWIAVEPRDYAMIAKQKGLPIEFAFPKEGAPARMYTVSVVKNAPHKLMAMELVNYLLRADVQERLADELKTVPINRDSKVAPDVAAMADKLYPVDMDYINAHRAEWIERWDKEIDRR